MAERSMVMKNRAGLLVYLSRLNKILTTMTAWAGGVVLLINVLVVSASVIWRYALHSPIEWAEEVARAMMIALVFFGVATSTGRGGHIGVDLFLRFIPERIRPYIVHASRWVLFLVAVGLVISSYGLLQVSRFQTTETGLPQVISVIPVMVGAIVMMLGALEHALSERRKVVLLSGGGIVLLVVLGWLKLSLMADPATAAAGLMLICFLLGILAGVPIAFTLGLSAMVFFICDPSLPFVFFSQQVVAGVDHFVLLAIPFFLLAGAAMEHNGMSTRLVELVVRGMGRFRGGLNMTTVLSMAFFSGISGSKLADVAAVGGVLMPAVRRANEDSEEAAGVFAASAVVAETIPPLRQSHCTGVCGQYFHWRAVYRRIAACRLPAGVDADCGKSFRRQDQHPGRLPANAPAPPAVAGSDRRFSNDFYDWPRRDDGDSHLNRNFRLCRGVCHRRRPAGVWRTDLTGHGENVYRHCGNVRRPVIYRCLRDQSLIRADHSDDPAANCRTAGWHRSVGGGLGVFAADHSYLDYFRCRIGRGAGFNHLCPYPGAYCRPVRF